MSVEKNVCYYSKNDNEFVFQELDDLRVNQNYMYIHLIEDDKKCMNFFFSVLLSFRWYSNNKEYILSIPSIRESHSIDTDHHSAP